MKYGIAWLEEFRKYDYVEADSPSEAIRKLWDMKAKGKVSKEVHGDSLGEIVNLKAENGDEFAFFDHELKQWRWEGKGLTEHQEEMMRKQPGI